MAGDRLGNDAAHQQGKGRQIDDDGNDDVNGLGRVGGLHGGTADLDIADKERRKNRADGVGAGQQGDRDAVEAHAEDGFFQHVLARTGQVVDSAADAGQRAGDDHGQHDVTLGVDARVLGSVAAQAAGLQLIAEGRLLQDDPDEDGKNNRDDDRNIDPARVAEQCRKRPPGQDRTGVCNVQRGGAVRVRRAPAGGQHIGHVGQQQIDEVHADPVEHDGGDDLIDVEIRLEQARENAPDRTADSARQQADVPRQLELNGAQQREESAHRVLAGRTNVEQARLERKADGQAAHHQGCRLVQHLAELVHAGKASGQHSSHAAHGGAGIQQDQQYKAQHQTDDDGQKAGQDPYNGGTLQKRLFILFAHAFASPCFLAPAIYRPSSSTVVFFGSNSPTISPS